MSGEKLLKILEILEKTTINVANFANAFATNKGESSRRLRNFPFTDAAPLTEALRRNLKERRKTAAYVSFLKKDGLVAESGDRIKLTTSGILKLRSLRELIIHRLPVKKYNPKQSDGVLLIIFDIPEMKRRLRHWLRLTIKEMGMKMIQRSVWLGKIKLPKEFIEDLKALK